MCIRLKSLVELDSIESQNIALGDAVLRVSKLKPSQLVAVDAPTLVFLHDSLGCISLWRDFPTRLCELTGCPALIYDRQGYGESSEFTVNVRTNAYLENEAIVLLKLLEQQTISRSILFGHSDGGSIALLAAALDKNERIAGIISEGAHVFVEELTLVGLREAQQQYETTNLKRRLEKYHGAKTDAMFRAWVDTWLSPRYRDWNIEQFLPSVKCPVLVLQGTDDEYGTAKQVQAIANGTSGFAQIHLIDAGGHSPHKIKTEETLSVSADFIATRILSTSC